MKMYVAAAAVAVAFGLEFVTPAGAATLTMNLTVDNQFTVYVSSSDATLGTFVGSGNAWQTTYSFSDPLSGPVEYIHVIGVNWTSNNGLWLSPGTLNGTGDNPDGFIGTFGISGSGYEFANGSTTLSTNTTDWRGSPAGTPPYATIPTTWTGATGTPQSYGLNGVGPWGGVSSVSSSAEWIWSNPDNGNFAEFSTTISSVPEASTWAMLLSGFAALGFAAFHLAGKRRPASIAG